MLRGEAASEKKGSKKQYHHGKKGNEASGTKAGTHRDWPRILTRTKMMRVAWADCIWSLHASYKRRSPASLRISPYCNEITLKRSRLRG